MNCRPRHGDRLEPAARPLIPLSLISGVVVPIAVRRISNYFNRQPLLTCAHFLPLPGIEREGYFILLWTRKHLVGSFRRKPTAFAF
jgi:hypothetical protein